MGDPECEAREDGVGVSPESRELDARGVEDRGDVRHEVLHAMRLHGLRPAAASAAALVHQDLREPGQSVHVARVLPDAAVAARARVEQDGRPLTADLMVNGHPSAVDDRQPPTSAAL